MVHTAEHGRAQADLPRPFPHPTFVWEYRPDNQPRKGRAVCARNCLVARNAKPERK